MPNTQNQPSPTETPPMARTLAFTSGKGGVGKTCLVANLGVELARQGYRVCIFDADTGLANINILLDLQPQYTLEHLIKGEKTVDEILLAGPNGLRIVPAASGIAECANLDIATQQRLLAALSSLESSFDFLLIDTAAGAGNSVLRFLQAAESVYLIITHEPTSLTDAFSLLKLHRENHPRNPIVNIIVNLAVSFEASVHVYNLFKNVVNKYLGAELHYSGFIPLDQQLTESVTLQQPVVIAYPRSPSSLSFMKLASSLREPAWRTDDSENSHSYWQTIIAPSASSVAADSTKTFPNDWREFLDMIRTADYTEQQFRQLLDSLHEAFRAKYATPYRTEGERKLAQARTLVAELEKRMKGFRATSEELEKKAATGLGEFRELSRLLEATDEHDWTWENLG